MSQLADDALNGQISQNKGTSEMALIHIAAKNGIKIYGAFLDDLSLPLLIYKGVFQKGARKKDITSFLASHQWSANSWTWASGASATPHYHDNCHEALIVLHGDANIKWGINGNIAATAHAGDVIFQPAGCYHAGNGCSQDCVTMGIYPDNSPGWYFNYDGPTKKQQKSIAKVPVPKDPVFGGNIISEFTKLLRQKMN